METIFYIVLNIKTVKGFESFGKFFLGNDKEVASNTFRQLKGNKNVNEKSILQLDFMETIHELPVNIQMISCTLEELAENSKIITKEIFKSLSLEEI